MCPLDAPLQHCCEDQAVTFLTRTKNQASAAMQIAPWPPRLVCYHSEGAWALVAMNRSEPVTLAPWSLL